MLRFFGRKVLIATGAALTYQQYRSSGINTHSEPQFKHEGSSSQKNESWTNRIVSERLVSKYSTIFPLMRKHSGDIEYSSIASHGDPVPFDHRYFDEKEGLFSLLKNAEINSAGVLPGYIVDALNIQGTASEIHSFCRLPNGNYCVAVADNICRQPTLYVVTHDKGELISKATLKKWATYLDHSGKEVTVHEDDPGFVNKGSNEYYIDNSNYDNPKLYKLEYQLAARPKIVAMCANNNNEVWFYNESMEGICQINIADGRVNNRVKLPGFKNSSLRSVDRMEISDRSVLLRVRRLGSLGCASFSDSYSEEFTLTGFQYYAYNLDNNNLNELTTLDLERCAADIGPRP